VEESNGRKQREMQQPAVFFLADIFVEKPNIRVLEKVT